MCERYFKTLNRIAGSIPRIGSCFNQKMNSLGKFMDKQYDRDQHAG